jgi:hypothetical protein
MDGLGRVRARIETWWSERSPGTRQWLIRGVVGLAAAAAMAGALWVTRDTSREFESLTDAYESMSSVGLDCGAPARTDVSTGRKRTLCSASDGSLAVLQLSDSLSDAQAAVGDAHADSEAVLHYAQIAKQTPVMPRPVLLGDNWTLVANTTVLERVAAECGGTIYPYPETPVG